MLACGLLILLYLICLFLTHNPFPYMYKFKVTTMNPVTNIDIYIILNNR